MFQKLLVTLAIVLVWCGCQKSFLDEKPSTGIVQPTTLEDMFRLLDNVSVMNQTGALPQMSSDEYFIKGEAVLASLNSVTQRHAYTWEMDIYGGEVEIRDWNIPFKAIMYVNNVLESLAQNADRDTPQGRHIAGWALFARAYAMFDLVRNFAPVYEKQTADQDLGIPIRLSGSIDEVVGRASLGETYQQILNDITAAIPLLDQNIPFNNRNRPSKVAAYALLARVNIAKRDYQLAEIAADSCLSLFNLLIDYNTVDRYDQTPFSYNTEETIFFSNQVFVYSTTTGYGSILSSYYGVDTALLALYEPHDLRKSIFFHHHDDGYATMKRGYVGGGFYAFTGLATDEVYLIKSECAARRSDNETALHYLNALLEKRYKSGKYEALTIDANEHVLQLILTERRKELIWRALRWSDIKRLNKEGANITLERSFNGQLIQLEPNSPRYVFPIPDDEIALSGIEQNER